MEWSSYQFGPAADVDLLVQVGGEEDEQQQGEEESCAADKLKEVERAALDAAVDHFLQDEGHEGQELMEKHDQQVKEETFLSCSQKSVFFSSCLLTSCN